MFHAGAAYPPLPCRDVTCGKLFCHDGQEIPNYGSMVRFGACKASFYNDYTKDYGQVEPGTQCGEGKVGAARGVEGLSRGLNRDSGFYRCAARTSVWACRRPTGTPTVRPSAPVTP